VDLERQGLRTYISEPRQRRRRWHADQEARDAVYSNRRRIRGRRGKALLRRRGERLERPFAHLYETGGMRRTHLRGRSHILKRVLIHVSALNLGFLMRAAMGVGTPRGLQGRTRNTVSALIRLYASVFGALSITSEFLRLLSWLTFRFRPLAGGPGTERQTFTLATACCSADTTRRASAPAPHLQPSAAEAVFRSSACSARLKPCPDAGLA